MKGPLKTTDVTKGVKYYAVIMEVSNFSNIAAVELSQSCRHYQLASLESQTKKVARERERDHC